MIRRSGPTARLVCRGALRPTPVTSVYSIRLEYAVGQLPIAVVEEPLLTGRPDGEEIPHMYPANEQWPARPCLYYPSDGDWATDRSLATTIVPWLLEWLLHYEVWLTTGEWRGGGVEHRPISSSGPGDSSTETATPQEALPLTGAETVDHYAEVLQLPRHLTNPRPSRS
jgi:hypothetical protein